MTYDTAADWIRIVVGLGLAFTAGSIFARYWGWIQRELRRPDDADYMRLPLTPAPDLARVDVMRQKLKDIPKHPKVLFYGDETGLEARRRVWGPKR